MAIRKIILLLAMALLAMPACKEKKPEEASDEKPQRPDIPTPVPPTPLDRCTDEHKSFATAIPITDDTAFHHTANICEDGIMIYKLSVKGHYLYTFTLSFSELDDLDLFIFDTDDKELGRSYYGNPEVIVKNLPAGDYYIAVYGYVTAEGSIGSQYELDIKTTPTCDYDNECPDDQYCNIFSGHICTPFCNQNEDCEYEELSCVPEVRKCVWGECFTNDECAIFGQNAPVCAIHRNDQDFNITRYCSPKDQSPHCAADSDPLEKVTNEISNNDDFLNPYSINVSQADPFEQTGLLLCQEGSGDFYQITPSGAANSVLDVTIKITGSDSLYLAGALIDPTSGRKVDGGSLDIADWDLCQNGHEVGTDCSTDSNGTRHCNDKTIVKECNLLITYNALKWAANKPLLLVVSRYPLTLKYLEASTVDTIVTTVPQDKASAYDLNITVEASELCTSDQECTQLTYPRTSCRNACIFNNSFAAYQSNLSEPCLNYLDCNLRENFEYYCSITKGNAAANFCTLECNNSSDCAVFHGGNADDYICSHRLCYHSACEKDDDCPPDDRYHAYCVNQRCAECHTNNDCQKDANYPLCDPTFNTCSMCLNDTMCAGNDWGPSCLTIKSSSTYRLCGCHTDNDCSASIGHKCIPETDEAGTCGCENNDDCATGYSCFIDTGKCYKKS